MTAWPITANIAATVLSLPLLTLIGILVLNQVEARSQATAMEVADLEVRERALVRGVRAAGAQVRSSARVSALLRPDLATSLRDLIGSVPEREQFRAILGRDDVTDLVDGEPASAEFVADALGQLQVVLDHLLQVSRDEALRPLLVSTREAAHRAGLRVNALTVAAGVVIRGLRTASRSPERQWNGSAITDGTGYSFTLHQRDVDAVAAQIVAATRELTTLEREMDALEARLGTR